MDGLRFPLLDLPNIPLLKVFSFMSPLQLWHVSQEKPYCENLAKRIKFNITDTSANRCDIWIHYQTKRAERCEFDPTKTSEEQWRITVSSVSKFLGQSFKRLSLETENFETSWAWIHSDQRDVELLNLTMKNVEDPQKVLKTILKNGELKPLDILNLNLDVPESFEFSDPLIFDKTMENMELQSSSWLTIQNIVESNVKLLEVKKSKFRDEDLNSLLRNWMREEVRSKNSELSRTVKIKKCDKQKIKINVLLDGLHHEIRYQFKSQRLGKSYVFVWNDDDNVIVSVKEHTLQIH